MDAKDKVRLDEAARLMMEEAMVTAKTTVGNNSEDPLRIPGIGTSV